MLIHRPPIGGRDGLGDRRSIQYRWIATCAARTIAAGCARHPTLSGLPQLATRTPAIAVDPETGRKRLEVSVLICDVAGLPWPVRTGRSPALREIGRQLQEMRAAGTAPDLLLLQEAFTVDAVRIGVSAGYRNGVRGARKTDRPGIEAVRLFCLSGRVESTVCAVSILVLVARRLRQLPSA